MDRGAYLGSSLTQGRHYVGRWLREHPAATVADFGVGSGKYGEMIRRALPDARIVGCDGHLQAAQSHRGNGSPYDEVYHALAEEFARRPEAEAEVWAFGDVLEHLLEPRADFVLRKALERGVRNVLISIPVGLWPQQAQPRNHLEEHLWTFYPSKVAGWTGWEAEVAAVVSVGKFKGPERRVYFDLEDRAEYRQHVDEFLGHFVLRRAGREV